MGLALFLWLSLLHYYYYYLNNTDFRYFLLNLAYIVQRIAHPCRLWSHRRGLDMEKGGLDQCFNSLFVHFFSSVQCQIWSVVACTANASAAWSVLLQFHLSCKPTGTITQPSQPITDPVITHKSGLVWGIRQIPYTKHAPNPIFGVIQLLLWPNLAQPTCQPALMFTHVCYVLAQPNSSHMHANRCCNLVQLSLPTVLAPGLTSRSFNLAGACPQFLYQSHS